MEEKLPALLGNYDRPTDHPGQQHDVFRLIDFLRRLAVHQTFSYDTFSDTNDAKS